MDVLWIVLAVIVTYLCVQVGRLCLADCDLTLQWATVFGKKPSTLKGKVVWIVGASSGIGEFLSYELAKAGCRLVLSARREKELERVKQKCLSNKNVQDDDILILPLDVLQCSTHSQAVTSVLNYFNKIDILVNNAGRSQRAAWGKISIDVHREVLELNVIGMLSVTKAVLPHMIERNDGHIVVVSSVVGKLGAPYSGSYTGSKHALHGFFESLRIEAYPHKIAITMICPGPVFSNVLKVAFTEEKGQVANREMNPNEKRMQTSRCAHLIAVAMANRLDEAWISLNPVLAFMYISQYFPTYARKIACRMGTRIIMKMREGQ